MRELAHAAKKRRLQVAVKLLVGVGLLFLLLQRVEPGRILDVVARLTLAPLLIALAVKYCGILSQVSRWQLLLKSRGAALGWLDLLRITLASRFLNLFLPGQIGGDLYRVVGVRKHTTDLLQSMGVVLMERYLSLVATLLMAAVAILGSGFTATAPALAYFVLALLGGALLASVPSVTGRGVRLVQIILKAVDAPEAWREHLERAQLALSSIVSSPWLLFRFILLCLVMNSATILQIHLLGKALGLDVPLTQLAFFMPLYNIACAIPISINSLGVRETSLVAFFTRMGLPQEEVTTLALLLLIWLYLTDVPNGLLLLLGEPATRPQPGETQGMD